MYSMVNKKHNNSDKEKTAQKKRTVVNQLKRYLSLIVKFPMNKKHIKIWEKLVGDYSK